MCRLKLTIAVAALACLSLAGCSSKGSVAVAIDDNRATLGTDGLSVDATFSEDGAIRDVAIIGPAGVVAPFTVETTTVDEREVVIITRRLPDGN